MYGAQKSFFGERPLQGMNNGGRDRLKVAGAAFNDGHWHHLAVTFGYLGVGESAVGESMATRFDYAAQAQLENNT